MYDGSVMGSYTLSLCTGSAPIRWARAVSDSIKNPYRVTVSCRAESTYVMWASRTRKLVSVTALNTRYSAYSRRRLRSKDRSRWQWVTSFSLSWPANGVLSTFLEGRSSRIGGNPHCFSRKMPRVRSLTPRLPVSAPTPYPRVAGWFFRTRAVRGSERGPNRRPKGNAVGPAISPQPLERRRALARALAGKDETNPPPAVAIGGPAAR